jgi:hypothetical protein
MEMHASVHTEIHEPVTHEIKHRKGILGVGAYIEVKPYGVLPLYETKRLPPDSQPGYALPPPQWRVASRRSMS